jgi:hypothetical protein
MSNFWSFLMTIDQLYFYQNEDVLLENSKSYCINQVIDVEGRLRLY